MCVQLHIKYGSAAFEVFWELHSLKVMHCHLSDTVYSRNITVLRDGIKSPVKLFDSKIKKKEGREIMNSKELRSTELRVKS